jgi:hypothetical protein
MTLAEKIGLLPGDEVKYTFGLAGPFHFIVVDKATYEENHSQYDDINGVPSKILSNKDPDNSKWDCYACLVCSFATRGNIDTLEFVIRNGVDITEQIKARICGKVVATQTSIVPAPKNNDNQTVCFWCGGELKDVPTGHISVYKICKVCGK